MSQIPTPRGGIETDWHAACILTHRKYRKILKAAKAALAEVDANLAEGKWPVMYRAPFGPLAKLREAIDELEYRPALPAPIEDGEAR